MSALTREQLDAYARDGFVHLEAAFPPELAARCRARLWEQLDESPDDPSTWTRPIARLGTQRDEPFRVAVASPRWLDAIHTLAPGGRPESWLSGTVAVRFPVPGDPGDDGWHVDGGYAGPDGRWWLNRRSDGRALLMLALFSDVGADDAPTRLRVGSHHDVPDRLAPFGDAGVAALDFPLPVLALERPIAYATGLAGDVYLCHPFLVHAAQRHRGHEPRFVAQPGVPWHAGPPRD